MLSIFNEALERASNPSMPPPPSPHKTTTSPSRTSTLFQSKIKETVVAVPGTSSTSPSPSTTSPRPSTPRPTPVDLDLYASGALPALSLFPSDPAGEPSASSGPSSGHSSGLPDTIRIPPFKSTSHRAYVSNYPEDEVDWSQPTPPLPPPSNLGPCRNFRDPYAAAREERDRHFAMQRRRRLEKLVSTSDTPKDAPALLAAGSRDDLDPPGLQELSWASGPVDVDPGFAGEIGSVYVPSAWRSRSTAERSAGEDDVFSELAEDSGDTDYDEEEEWHVEFAKAEEEVSDAIEDGREWRVRYEHSGPEAWMREDAAERSKSLATEPMPGSATAPGAADPATAPYVKRTPLTAASPTESQLAASGFEFHNALSEEEQIAQFGDKAFRKALRETLPSLSRAQQWYAWRRVKVETGAVGAMDRKQMSKEEQKDENGKCEDKRLGSEESDSGDRHRDKLDRLRRPDGAYETEGALREKAERTGTIKWVCGKSGKKRDEGQTVSNKDGGEALACKTTSHMKTAENREPDAWRSTCGCTGDESNGQFPPHTPCENCQRQHHPAAANPQIADRPSDWNGLFRHGRLVDVEPASTVREELNLRHDEPVPLVPRIPGLGLLDPPSNPQSMQEPIRRSVEPETPRRQLCRDSTPAFENRSPSPSPVSHRGNLEDVDMTDAPSAVISAPHTSHPSLPQQTAPPDPLSSLIHGVAALQTPDRPQSRSPGHAPITTPGPSAPKSTKRGGRRKSAVQGSKIEKTSASKSRAVSRKVTTAAKNVADKTEGKVKEAVAKIEASVKKEHELTPRRSARIRAKLEREETPKD